MDFQGINRKERLNYLYQHGIDITGARRVRDLQYNSVDPGAREIEGEVQIGCRELVIYGPF